MVSDLHGVSLIKLKFCLPGICLLLCKMLLSWLCVLLASCLIHAAGSAVDFSTPYAQDFQGINLLLTRVRRPKPQLHAGVLTSNVSISNSHD